MPHPATHTSRHAHTALSRNALRQGVASLDLVLGAWLFASPFLFGITSTGQWHLYFWGAVLVLLGGYEFSRANRHMGPLTGVSILVAVLGIWVALSPLFYPYGLAATWNNVLVGALLAGSGVYMTNEASRLTPRRTA